MIKVIHAASWFARRHFYSFSHWLYRNDMNWRESEIWGGRGLLSPRRNELLRGEHTLLMVVKGGRVLARVLTGTAPHTDGDGRREGYFALLDMAPDREALRALTDEMRAWHGARGTYRIIGPIAPTPADLGGGVLCEGFAVPAAFGDCFNAPYYDEYLQNCGFRVESEWLAYHVDIGNRFDCGKYRKASEKLCLRFGYRTETQTAAHPRKFSAAVCGVMGIEERQEEMNRVIAQLMPFVEKRLCPVVFVGEKPIGFLLTIRKKSKEKHPQPPRIVTLWVHEAWRRKGVTAVLFDRFAQEAQKLHIMQTDASLICADNLASKLGAEYAGGTAVRRYRQYYIYI